MFWKRWRWHCLWSLIVLVGVGVPDPGQGSGTRSLLVANVNAFAGEEELLMEEISSFDDSFVIQVEQRVQSFPNMHRVAFDERNKFLRTK